MAEQQYLTVPHLNRKQLHRIFSKVRLDAITGCWNWTASVNTGGYGSVGGKTIVTGPVHRILYAWLVEPLPRGIGRYIPQLDHFACDNRRCVNPSHVKLVSARENNLRGLGMGARWAKRTHCNKGHEFMEPEMASGKIRRRCRLCQKRDERQLAMHRAAQKSYLARLKIRLHLLHNPDE